MRIEHFAINVSDSIAVADWYVKNLGFQILRSGSAPSNARFIADETGKVLIEIYNNAKAPVPDYPNMPMLMLHLALVSSDLKGDVARLVAAGGKLESEETTRTGDEMAVVRDPWGLALQLIKRKEPML